MVSLDFPPFMDVILQECGMQFFKVATAHVVVLLVASLRVNLCRLETIKQKLLAVIEITLLIQVVCPHHKVDMRALKLQAIEVILNTNTYDEGVKSLP